MARIIIGADNFHLNVKSYLREHILEATKLAASCDGLMPINAFCVHESCGLVLLPGSPKTFVFADITAAAGPLPFPLKDPQAVADFIEAWLKQAQYPKEPDLDGSCSKAFRIHTFTHRGIALIVEPVWAEFHK